MRHNRREVVVPTLPETIQRVWQLAALLGFVLVVILYKIWSLQVLESQYYIEESKGNYERITFTPSVRGTILDRRGRILAEDVHTYDVYVSAKRTNGTRLSNVEMGDTITRLRSLIPLRRNPLGERFGDGRYRVARRLSFEQMVELEERRLEYPEVSVERVPGRRYPHGDLAAHVLGYTLEISPEELEAHQDEEYKPGDRIGKAGVEKEYEQVLRGIDGVEIVQYDAVGHPLEVLRVDRDARRGRDLVMSVDLDLQRVAERVLGASRGSIVVMNPQDGSLMALASNPRFDPNTFSKDLGRHIMDESRPLTHRAIQGLYPPGSTFKLFEAAGLLERDVATPHDTVYCGGQHKPFGGRAWKCHIWSSHHRGHGAMDMENAVMLSCDTYFYVMGRRLGISNMADWAERFGLGVPTGIDIPREKWQRFPCPASGYEPWYPGETINCAIGQGKISISPLQLAVAASTLANATGQVGTVYKPRVALGPLAGYENGRPVAENAEPRVARRIVAATQTWKTVQYAARRACDPPRGTGRRCIVEGFRFSGKTGTAQHGGSAHTNHAWFVCWGPTDDGQVPEILVVVLAEESGHGGENASVLVPPIIEAYLRGSRQDLV